MKVTLSLVLVSVAGGCAVDTSGSVSVTASAVKVNAAKDGTEPAFVNGALCTMVFPGGLTSATEFYGPWAIGTKGIVSPNADKTGSLASAYNTPGRPNLYAVFGTNSPPAESHHVDGFDQFDHYHVLDNPPGEDEVENTKWDLLALFPGPNFDATTYQVATSADELLAQSAAGVLSPVLTAPQIGFPPLVLYTPVNCPDTDGH